MLKHITTVAVGVGLATVFAACDQDAKPTSRYADPPRSTAETVAKEAEEAVRAAAAHAQQTKRMYEKKIQEKLSGVDGLIAELRSKAENATVESKEVLARAVEDLEEKKNALRERLVELETTSADASQRIESAIESALADLEHSFDKATSELE